MVSETRERVNAEVLFRAFITTPSGFDPAKESLPMIVFLHGAGERGDDLSLVRIHGIPKLFGENPDYHGLRVITVSPQCPAYTVWNDVSIQLFEFILKTAEKYNADINRISITGLSMGGFGTWELLISHSDFFSAGAPICGGGMDWRIPADMKTPVRAFHGDADPTVPVEYSKFLCKAVNERGDKAELTVYSGCGHDSWTEAYERTELIEWLSNSERSCLE